jgi:excinuclease ABC subunit C
MLVSLKDKIKLLPNNPGVYQFFNKEGRIIYVGKAKHLKNRVSSYFNREKYENNKLRILVKNTVDIQHIVVQTESDALLLENNLIKKYQPRYNILLKDDKSFPFICVKNETFPRVFSTRNPVNDGSLYFGPYTSMVMVRTLLELIRQLYPLRNCNFALSDDNIRNNKFKVCLEYHLGNCKAPCVGLQSLADYEENIEQIRLILKGNIHGVLDFLKKKMKQKSAEMKFEEAQFLKEKIDILSKYQSKSAIVNPSISNVDVFSYFEKDEYVAVNYLRVINGAIIQAYTIETKKVLDEYPSEILAHAILDIRSKVNSTSREILVPFSMELNLPGMKILLPKKGDKKTLLELSERNAKYFLLEKLKLKEISKVTGHTDRILDNMQKDLGMDKAPRHIECFDNSNIQGTHPVASCVVFKNARPSVKEYRHYNIKNVKGQDDFSSMEEILYRRYKRLTEDSSPLPDLIVVDGGKGQLSSAMRSLGELGLEKKIHIIAIAKKLEEIFFPGDPVPLYLDKNSETLKVIQHIRNEAHRFAISFHRQKRSGDFVKTELTEIQGIGEIIADKLLREFGSVEKIKKLSAKELEPFVGKRKADILVDYFNKEN